MSDERLYTKYKNRRLYDVITSKYVGIADIALEVCTGSRVLIKEATSGRDITSEVLLTIMLGMERKLEVPNLLEPKRLEMLIREANRSLKTGQRRAVGRT